MPEDVRLTEQRFHQHIHAMHTMPDAPTLFGYIREVVLKTTPTPSVSEIARYGRDPFRILVSTIISLRTKDQVTLDASKRLFAAADTPESMIEVGSGRIAELIYPCGFYRVKSGRIIEISTILLSEHDGSVPPDRDALLSLPGVGRKTANLTLSLGFSINAICVDIHVHRISRRLGWSTGKTPDETELQLTGLMPESLWIPLNDILVRFGQNICTPRNPRCGCCPVEPWCPKFGVD